MSRPRFLADHDISGRLVDGIVRMEPAIDLTLLRNVLHPETPDPQILQFAAQNGVVVLSHDVNTMSAAAWARVEAGQALAGLILIPQRTPLGRTLDDLLRLWL